MRKMKLVVTKKVTAPGWGADEFTRIDLKHEADATSKTGATYRVYVPAGDPLDKHTAAGRKVHLDIGR